MSTMTMRLLKLACLPLMEAVDSMPVLEEDVLAAGSPVHGDDLVRAQPLAAPALPHARSEADSLTVLERCVALRQIFGHGPK